MARDIVKCYAYVFRIKPRTKYENGDWRLRKRVIRRITRLNAQLVWRSTLDCRPEVTVREGPHAGSSLSPRRAPRGRPHTSVDVRGSIHRSIIDFGFFPGKFGKNNECVGCKIRTAQLYLTKRKRICHYELSRRLRLDEVRANRRALLRHIRLNRSTRRHS